MKKLDKKIRSWYKDPRIIVPAIVVIIATIIGATWNKILNPPPEDFKISVSPMHGVVKQGGLIQTTITVKGVHGYDYLVNLSASGYPSDVVIDFNPSFGDPARDFVSTVTINVGSKVLSGDHIVIIRGTGADGNEHSCKYILNIKSSDISSNPPSSTLSQTLPVVDYVVFSDIVLAGGDVWVWSGADWGLESPLLVDASFVDADVPEGNTCFAISGGSGFGNYVGWGVFLGIFEDHEVITPHTVDLSGYEKLEFWVKTKNNLKVEIQQDNARGKKSSPCLISNYGWEDSSNFIWQKIFIPRDAFRNVDLTKIFCPYMITGKGDQITYYVDEIKWTP